MKNLIIFLPLLLFYSCKNNDPAILDSNNKVLISSDLIYFPKDPTGYSLLPFREKVVLTDTSASLVVAYGEPDNYSVVLFSNNEIKEIARAIQVQPIVLVVNFEKVYAVAYKNHLYSRWSVISKNAKIHLLDEFDPFKLPKVYTLPLNRGDDRN